MKKAIIILGFVIFVVLMGFLIYTLFFKPVISPPAPPMANLNQPEKPGGFPKIGPGVNRPGVQPGKTTLPSVKKKPVPVSPPPSQEFPSKIAQGGLTEVKDATSEPSLGATLTPSGGLVYYSKDDNKFYKIQPDGTKIPYVDKEFYEVSKINWSPNKDKAILEYPDNSKILYDFQKRKQYTLLKNWNNFSFSPDGNQIAFTTESVLPEDRWLAISQPDGTGARPIEDLGENADKVIVSWSPNNQIIAFSKTGEPMGTWLQEIYPVGLHHENFLSLIVNGRGFQPKWSPDGKKLLYSVYNPDSDFKPILWITDCYGQDIGNNNLSLGLNTWADKCVFSPNGEELYCAVPRELPQGAGFYPEMNTDIVDDFYKINLKTGQKILIAQPAGDYNVKDPFLSPDGKYLYFTDKRSNQVKRIQLK